MYVFMRVVVVAITTTVVVVDAGRWASVAHLANVGDESKL